jgi:hypothetical protein
MSYTTDPAKWALSYLKGRADGFRRRRLTSANVLAAIHNAVTLGVAQDEIVVLLNRYGLTWDSERDVIQQR